MISGLLLKVYAGLAILAVAAAGYWYVANLRADNMALRASVSALEREVANAEERIAQAKEARAVASAEAKRLAAAAAKYDDLREWILRRDDNAPIPDLLRDALDRLFNRPPR